MPSGRWMRGDDSMSLPTAGSGNLLPYIRRWPQLPGELPKDELLIDMPEDDTKHKKTVTTVALLLKEAGHHVRVVSKGELTPPRVGKETQAELGI